jgi:hypothetical protein
MNPIGSPASPARERWLEGLRGALARFGLLFPRHLAVHDVVTQGAMRATPAEVWQRLMFFEEVPHRPGLALRLLLPVPLKTSKPALRVGATVHCTYSGGKSLVKRITAIDAPSLLQFEVLEQDLGIEACLTTVEGSYRIRESAEGTSVTLTTRYRGHLRPRWLWRAPERWIAGALHRHILRGIGASFDARQSRRSA